MLKDYAIIKRISAEISSAADTVVKEVLADYGDIHGREEEVTAQLRGELNRHLLDNVSKSLDGQKINGCTIKVATLKKTQEKHVGADLVGVLEISRGSSSISKAFLAQAKVGSCYIGAEEQTFVRAYSKDIISQVDSMLKMSSDSFVFIYSNAGILCVPAFQVRLAGSPSIDTARHPFHSFGAFFEEFFKCFIGDHLISPQFFGAKGLEDYAEKLKASSVLWLSIQLKDK